MSILTKNVNWYNNTTEENRVIAWWSGGVASAIACKIALETYPNVELVFCDTGIEHPDTYRFMADFERVLNVKIHKVKSDKFSEPEEVWEKYRGMNFAHGAPCSSELKAFVRVEKVQDLENDYCQIFGFDFCKKEINRSTNMVKSHPELNPKFPLIEHEITRERLFVEISKLGIEPPEAYKYFLNNNCIGDPDSEKGGCVQGGIGYWMKIKEVFPKKYKYMGEMEHHITEVQKQYQIEKGKYDEDTFKPVTLCRDQRKATHGNRLFLIANPLYPEVETVDVINSRIPMSPFECNGFCSIDSQESQEVPVEDDEDDFIFEMPIVMSFSRSVRPRLKL